MFTVGDKVEATWKGGALRTRLLLVGLDPFGMNPLDALTRENCDTVRL